MRAATMTSLEPFNHLVRLTARAFYHDASAIIDGAGVCGNPRTTAATSRGTATAVVVVVLDALTRHHQRRHPHWVREDDLAASLKLHPKQLRRVLRFLEEEKLVARDHRKEPAAAATGSATGCANKSALPRICSYCCLDYAQIYDVVRYRIYRMKKKLRDELDSRDEIQHYICPRCKRMYSALDALQLVTCSTDEYFHCESCDGELIIAAESDAHKIGSEEKTGHGDGDGSKALKRRRREELIKDMLRRIDEQLEPLVKQIQRVKELPFPVFMSLQSWGRANYTGSDFVRGDVPGAADSSCVGGIEVEVALSTGSGADQEGVADKSGMNGSGTLKAFPSWMVREGMDLTEEQRGETSCSSISKPSKANEKSETEEDDRKPDAKEEDENNTLQYEYAKAFYEALMKRQEEEDAKRMQQEAHKFSSDECHPKRQLGMKSKREDEGVDWEEEQPAGSTAGAYNFVDLNDESPECGDHEDDDDIDWEEC